MAKQRRVHEIAKELGINSKIIVDKCVAEGIPGITNHMSPVKIGLEATMKEWFSGSAAAESGAAAGYAGTAVETAPKVDSNAVKVARRKKVEPKAPEPAAEVKAKPEPVRKKPAPGPNATVSPAPPRHEAAPETTIEPGDSGPPVSETEAPAAPSETPSIAASSAPAAPAAPAPEVRAAGRPNVPLRPSVVRQVGTALGQPTQAVLKGPKVVRIEKPENLQAPRPRRPMGQPGGGGGAQTGGGSSTSEGSGVSRSRGPVRGRGAGAPGAGPVEAESPAKGKRRSLSTRRGRSAEALPVGPTKFTDQDIAELDARLNHATGFLKQRRRDLKKTHPGQIAQTAAVSGGAVEVIEPITIKSMSAATGLKATDIIKYLFKKGVMATINSAIGAEMAQEVALEYNIELVVREQQTVEQVVVAEFESREATDLRPRPPVVTVMGHVDHGKTSLLDKIRKSDVAAHEAGGITQHVGAYRITVKGTDGKDKTTVFLDTPGHEAFTTMRSRGAKMTDMVVLVVAADDGVMPQTIESINHARAAGVPIIVALNKIDKAEATEANVRKIFGQLAEHGLNPTEWGGTTEVVRVSASKGTGVTELVEMLDYQAALLDLKADYAGRARGTVIESEMKPGRGPVARVLVQQGRIKVGDFVVIGRAFGRVRDMTDEYGHSIAEAGPATPLEISGIDMIPDAGDKMYIVDTLGKAEEIASTSRESERHKQLASQTKVTLDNFAQQMAAGTTKDLRIVLKADVQGSIDVLKKSLSEQGNAEVTVKVLHAAVGGITESDVLLADASDAVVIGFHVVAPAAVKEIAEARGVDIRLYRIIYEVVDDIKKSLEGLLEPEKREEELGVAEVREVFRISKLGSIAGCIVLSGVIQRSGKLRVIRDSVVVTENRNVESLRRVKDDVKEVRAGMECGIRLQNFEDLKPGDRIVSYNTLTVKRTLEK
ncbi:MAG: translation initiation factor IF-2 [Planctomycetes bacterium]|nr:translation initiation factor IF-2 [Planctomycetota bacterium]